MTVRLSLALMQLFVALTVLAIPRLAPRETLFGVRVPPEFAPPNWDAEHCAHSGCGSRSLRLPVCWRRYGCRTAYLAGWRV